MNTFTDSQGPCWFLPPTHLSLGIDDVHVWRAALDRPPPAVQALYDLLSLDERERAAKFCFQSDREHFVVARGVLRSIICRYLLIAPDKVDFRYGLNGKPGLPESSGRPPLRFNVSHSHKLALFAFTRNREVGLDLEYMREDLADDGIADRFFSPREVSMLHELPASQRTRGFFNCWTRKEAYVKATGGGLSVPLDQFAVSLAPGEPAALLSTDHGSQELARWSLEELSPGAGYVAAIAIEGSDYNLRYWQWADS